MNKAVLAVGVTLVICAVASSSAVADSIIPVGPVKAQFAPVAELTLNGFHPGGGQKHGDWVASLGGVLHITPAPEKRQWVLPRNFRYQDVSGVRMRTPQSDPVRMSISPLNGPSAVPEPSGILALATGVIGIAGRLGRRRIHGLFQRR